MCAIVPTKHSILHHESLHQKNSMKRWLEEQMANERMEGYAEVYPTNKTPFCDAIWSSVIHTGLGPVSPNTVLISWFDSWRQQPPQASKDYIRKSSIYFMSQLSLIHVHIQKHLKAL